MKGYNDKFWRRENPQLQTDFLIREKIPNWLGNIEGKQILDAGCGEGYISRKLSKLGAKVKAFDISQDMIEIAKDIGGEVNYQVGDLSQVNQMFQNDLFDLVILSGVICSFNEKELYNNLEKLSKVVKKGGKILIATNHMESYLNHGESNWLKYTSKSKNQEDTQEVEIIFRDSKLNNLFEGMCYFHTKKQVSKSLESSGFLVGQTYEPLATKEDLNNFSHMWGDENKIPYHLVVIGEKL